MIKKLIRRIVMVILILNLCGSVHAQTSEQVTYPCGVVLSPSKDISNAQGVALITKVKKPYTDEPESPIRERESVGIYADWLPSPSEFGDFDQYEGFAQVPDIISWRFKMYPVKEDTPSWFGGMPWVGKFDEITFGLPKTTRVEVRLSNSKTNQLGPAMLQNTLQGCHRDT